MTKIVKICFYVNEFLHVYETKVMLPEKTKTILSYFTVLIDFVKLFQFIYEVHRKL